MKREAVETMKEKSDLRYVKTKEAIYSAFRTLLEKQEYNKITVKMLADTAKINRKTFYLHYNSLDDLLLELKMEIVQSGVDSIKKYQIPSDLHRMIEKIYCYWQSLTPSDYKVFHSAVNLNQDVTFFNQMKLQYNNFAKDFCAGDKVRQQIALAFIVETIGNMYSEWIKNFTHMDLDEMVDVVCNLICKGISG